MRRSLRTWIVVIAALGAACGGAPRTAEEPAAGGQSRKETTRRAREVVNAAYAALRRGDLDSLQPLFAADARVVGPGGADVFTTRTDVVVAMAGSLARKKHKLRSRGLTIAPSASGRSAWVADQLELDGVDYRITAVVAEADELWQVTALHVSRPARDGAAAGTATPVAATAGDPAGGEVAELAEAWMAAPEKLTEQLPKRGDAVVYGPGARDVARGLKAIRKHWKKVVAGQPKLAARGPVAVTLSPDGALAWVAADVDVAAGQAAAVARRLFLIYARIDGEWRLVAVHESSAA